MLSQRERPSGPYSWVASRKPEGGPSSSGTASGSRAPSRVPSDASRLSVGVMVAENGAVAACGQLDVVGEGEHLALSGQREAPRRASPMPRRRSTARAHPDRAHRPRTPALVGDLREWLWATGAHVEGHEGQGSRRAPSSPTISTSASASRICPSHRALALLRGRNEGILDLDLDVPHEEGKPHPAEGKIMAAFGIADRGRPADTGWARRRSSPGRRGCTLSLAADLLTRLKERADAEAIACFKRT